MNNDIVGVTKIMETAGFSGEKGGGWGHWIVFSTIEAIGGK